MTDRVDSGEAELRSMVEGTERLRRRARSDRRASSVPLLVFGAVTLVGAVFGNQPRAWFYWLFAGPAGFVATWWWYRRQEINTGIGPGQGSYLSIGLAVLLALIFVPLALAPLLAIGLALAVLAVRQHNRHLGAWAVVFGLLGGLESFFVISNRLTDLIDRMGFYRSEHGYFSWSSNLVIMCIGLLMLAGGLTALKQERGR